MKLSLTISSPGSRFAPIVLQGDYLEMIREADRLGYKAVELHIRDPKTIDAAAMTHTLDELGMKVSTIGTGQAYVDDRIYFTSPDPEVSAAAVQRIKDHVRLATKLGAAVIIGTIKGPLPGNPDEDQQALAKAAKCLAECADFAAQHNVELTLEAINRYETNFLNTGAEAVEFLRGLDRPNVGLHLDTFHMNIEEVDLAQTIRDCRHYLFHIHLADSNRWPPGYGHLDFKSVLKALKDIQYGRYMAIESLPKPDPQEGARRGREHIQELLDDL
ncbi:MAG: 5-keto-L-gluconate epimerase [Limnochordia bacterium]|jgi:sugar phosphate isomerase/epimerase